MPSKKRIILLFVLLPLFSPVWSREEFIEPPSRVLTTIPFEQLTGGVIILKAKFDSFSDTLNFILDSGSSGISVDSTLVADWGLVPEPSDRSIRGIAGIRKVSFLNNRQLHFPNLTVDSLDFHVNDYDILTSVYGINIDGIIGYSFLSRYIVKINYDSLKIDICTNGTIRYPKGGYLIKPTMGTLPVHHARLRDAGSHNPRFLHDIGAGLCLMLSSDFVEDSNVIQRKKGFADKRRRRPGWFHRHEGDGGKRVEGRAL
ncbi:MAG: retropepsin-like domain-containing protein [Chitinophagaceae bacterium]|nr:retropepsin-like domain-containing protein [Chitinophagaceae bacterium]